MSCEYLSSYTRTWSKNSSGVAARRRWDCNACCPHKAAPVLYWRHWLSCRVKLHCRSNICYVDSGSCLPPLPLHKKLPWQAVITMGTGNRSPIHLPGTDERWGRSIPFPSLIGSRGQCQEVSTMHQVHLNPSSIHIRLKLLETPKIYRHELPYSAEC